MREFNKLVRDKIPEIIKANDEIPYFHILEDDVEYLQALLQKDIEEGLELAQNPSLDELADKLEVIYAIAKTRGYTPQQIEQARVEKAKNRGGFDKRIFLEGTE
jgi:predicted house-cleaning noncanonical NTP pyrophosphatase (MazG superfamily)